MTDVVRTCRRTWRRLGVTRAASAELAAELSADLDQAAADGIDPVAYVGDARELAIDWATARGLVGARPRLLTAALAATAGALPGAAFALFAAYGLSSAGLARLAGLPVFCVDAACTVTEQRDVFDPPAWLLLLLYGLGALFASAGAIAAVAAVLRRQLDPAIDVTIRALVRAVPVATVVVLVFAIAVASVAGLPADGPLVAVAIIAVAAAVSLSAALARLRAVRAWRSYRVPGGVR